MIWNLFEEEGTAPARIDAFLQRYETLCDNLLAFMESLLQAEAGTPLAVRFRLGDPGPLWGLPRATGLKIAPACDYCRALDGKTILGSALALFPLLPPYALGCGLFPFPAGPRVADGVFAATLPKPLNRSIVCDDDWVMRAEWDAA